MLWPEHFGERTDGWADVTDRATKGQLEAAVSRAITRFEREFRGRGPRQVRARLSGAELRVELSGTMTAFERRVVNVLDDQRGARVLAELNRGLIEAARPALEAVVNGLTDRSVVAVHYEIDTDADRESLVFLLDAPPLVREKGKTVAAAT